ncbi:MAG: hypothetical protein ACP5LK_03245 [Candidatus Bipolaricaulaceae bacterium]
MGAPSEVMVVAALRTELLFVRGPKGALGMGEAARAGLRRLLDRRPAKACVLVGYCGGLAEDLPPGALILAERVVGPEGTVRVGARALAKAQALLPEARVGPIFTDPALLRKNVAKLKALEEHRISPLGVDMESNFVAAELFRRKIPFLVARVVLDPWEEEVQLGPSRFLWAPRAIFCSWKLAKAVPKLKKALRESHG